MLNVLILVLCLCLAALVLFLGLKKVTQSMRERCGELYGERCGEPEDNCRREEMVVGRLERERDIRKKEGSMNMCVIGEQEALMRRLHRNSWSGGGVTKVNEVVGNVSKLVAEDINKDTRRMELEIMRKAKKLALQECGFQDLKNVRLKKND